MFPFYQYPYMDYNAFNLDYLVKSMKEQGIDFKAFVSANVLKYHDPIAWNITTQYEPNTIVSDGTDVYLSKQPVPAGVAVTNTDYWFKVGDLSTYQLQLDTIRHQIAAEDEGNNVVASHTYAAGAVFWLNGYLSQASQNINAGETFANGVNYDRITVLDLLSDINSDINSINGNISTINTRISKIGFRKRVIAIGDSIARGSNPDETVTPWPVLMRQKLGLAEGSTFITSALGGAGFVNNSQGKNFLDLIQDVVLSDPETVTDIYVIGGVNDANMNASFNSEKTAVEAFCSYCNTAFPNAVVHIGCIAYFRDLGGKYNRVTATYGGMLGGCCYKAVFIDGMIGVMSDYSGYASDGLHVGQTIQNRIAMCALADHPIRFNVNMAGTPSSNFGNMPLINASINGDKLHYWLPYTTITPNSGTVITGNQWNPTIELGTITQSGILGIGHATQDVNWQQIPYVGVARQTANAQYVPCYGVFVIMDGKLYMSCQAAAGGSWAGGLNQIRVSPLEGSLPIV